MTCSNYLVFYVSVDVGINLKRFLKVGPSMMKRIWGPSMNMRVCCVRGDSKTGIVRSKLLETAMVAFLFSAPKDPLFHEVQGILYLSFLRPNQRIYDDSIHI